MQNGPYVYVVICTYNSEETLLESVRSVLEQSYSNLKLVLVNDGSTDGTVSVIDQIVKKDNRVHLINKTNSGLGDSRNKAIDYALSEGAEFIAFCDADDVWVPNKLELQMKVFEKEPDANVVVTDMITYDSELPESVDGLLSYQPIDAIFEIMCRRNFTFQPVTSVVRAHLFAEVAQFTDDKSGQDFYPFLRFAFEGYRYFKVEHKLYRERQLEGSLQRSPKSAFLGGRARTRAVTRLHQEMQGDERMTDTNVSLLNMAHDRYRSWMLSGARKALPYFEQLRLSVESISHFNNKTIALREVSKSLLYPMFHSISGR